MNYQYLFPQPQSIYPHNQKDANGYNNADDMGLLIASAFNDTDQMTSKRIEEFINVDGYVDNNKSKLNVMLHKSEKIIVSLLLMTLQFFVIYSLVISNTDNIRDNCGDSLWKFVLSRLIIGSLEFLIFVALSVVQMSILKYYFTYIDRIINKKVKTENL